MNGNEFNELFTSKIKTAKRGRALATAAASILTLALVIGIVAGAATLLKSMNGVPPDNSGNNENVDPIESPDNTGGDSSVPGGNDSTSAPIESGGDDKEDGSNPGGSEDPSEGGDAAENPEKYTHSVRLVWYDDDVPESQETVYIAVMRGDEQYAEFTLSPENSWSYEWEDEYPSEEISLMGVFPDGLTATYALNGDRFTLLTEPAEGTGEDSSGADGTDPSETGETAPGQTDGDATEGSGDSSQPGANAEGDGTEPGESGGDNLPQTGVEWLPAIVLFLLGTVCIVYSKRSLSRS